jgi:ATP-dependent RNA helicase DeaD
MSDSNAPVTFATMGLLPAIIETLNELDYETPTPVQMQTIPLLLSGRDVIGQAQTGSGKTAAFSLPILSRLKPGQHGVQALIMTPTRELALQVASAMETYAQRLRGVKVAAVYGGAPMDPQIRALHRGVDIVVGTPGRIIDHLERGTLKLENVHFAVLDEADQMLKMGFIEDVEHILSHIPTDSQRALFSATMPDPIYRIAKKSLREPATIDIESSAETMPSIEQRVIRTTEREKIAALTRLLETESFDAAIIFARTQARAAEVAESLITLGFTAEPLHGGLNQAMRERVISRLRSGALRIVVATDVAARGIDVDRITHVINFDIPFDVESYVHRIGRTGRAGREGIAYLLVNPPERRMLMSIERFINQRLTIVDLPGPADVARAREEAFRARIVEAQNDKDMDFYASVVTRWAEQLELDPVRIAAAAIRLATGEKSFVPPPPAPARVVHPNRAYNEAPPARGFKDSPPPRDRREAPQERRPVGRLDDLDTRPVQGGRSFDERPYDSPPPSFDRGPRRSGEVEPGMVRIFLSAGRQNGVRPQEVVAAIAGQSGITGRDIGYIDIHDRATYVDIRQDVVDNVVGLEQIDIGNRRAVIRVARPDSPPPQSDRRAGGPPPRFGNGGPRGGSRGGYNDARGPRSRR